MGGFTHRYAQEALRTQDTTTPKPTHGEGHHGGASQSHESEREPRRCDRGRRRRDLGPDKKTPQLSWRTGGASGACSAMSMWTDEITCTHLVMASP